MELRQEALRALRESDPRAKAAQAAALHGMAAQLPLSPSAPPAPSSTSGGGSAGGTARRSNSIAMFSSAAAACGDSGARRA